MENRLTAIEIINETVAFYSADTNRRSKGVGGDCLYAGLNGNKCAYSRCWKEGAYKPEYENCGVISSLLPKPDDLLEERYKGHSMQLWIEIQRIHDKNLNWNANGLTEYGKIMVEQLKIQFNDKNS